MDLLWNWRLKISEEITGSQSVFTGSYSIGEQGKELGYKEGFCVDFAGKDLFFVSNRFKGCCRKI